MRALQATILVLASFVASQAHAALIDNGSITVTGSLCTRCVSFPPDAFPPANTIDDDRTTFWHGENDLQIGEVNELIYQFDQHYQLERISLFNDFTNNYNMGELAFQYMDAGAWVTFHSVDGDFGRGDFEVLADVFAGVGPINTLRLEMTYQGRGAHGGTPAFYLSEIDFFGEAVAVPEPAAIDIKPGSDPNGVNPRSRGVIPVAVLGSIDFDAMQVDFTTVVFGPGGASPVHSGHVEDVNADGFPDFVVHFKVRETEITCGDTEATLTGETSDGTPFTGTDTVKTAGCK